MKISMKSGTAVSLKSLLAGACLTVGLSAGHAAEFDLQGAHIYPESFVQSGVLFEDWAKRVEEATDGRVAVNIVHGGALLSVGDQLDGISAGLVDVTSFYPIYEPGDFKVEGALTNIIDIWSDEVPDLEGVALIHSKLHEEFPEFKAEYERHNMVPLMPLPADPYVIACTEEVPDMASLEGRKMRTFGRYFPVLQENLGVEPVTVPGSEAYQALATGLVDCVYSTPDWIASNSLNEVAPNVFVPAPENARPQLLATAVVAMNKSSFDNLPEDIREILEKTSNDMLGYVGEKMTGVYDDAIKNLTKGDNTTIHHMTEDEMNKWAERTPNQLDQAAKDLNGANLPGDRIIARYRELAKAYVSGNWPE